MNDWQMAQQLRHLLKAAQWPTGGTVFGTDGVWISAGLPTTDFHPARFPFVIIVPAGGSPDGEEPALTEQLFDIVVATDSKGDLMGEQAIIGGPQRGAMEIAERARATLADLTGADGAPVLVSAASVSSLGLLNQPAKHVAFAQFQVSALCTTELFYTPPQQVASTSESVSWSGSQCLARFDFEDFYVGYKGGSTPPETPSEADEIVFTGKAESASIAVAAGRTYVVWAAYKVRSAIEGYSSGSYVGSYLVL